MNSPQRLILAGALALALPLMAGCDGPDARTYEVPTVREHDEIRRGTQAVVSDARRFGIQSMPPSHPGMGGGSDPHAGMDMSGMGGAPANPFAWELPDGWESIPGSEMRQGNFKVPARPDLECYLAILPGPSGGVVANVNRWRNQIGLAPLSDQDIEALPRMTILGKEGTLVTAEGSFSGMGGDARDGWALRGLILEAGSRTLFVKMTGPKVDVDAESGAFDAFCASLSGRRPETERPPPPSPVRWIVPEGWTEGAQRTMRIANMHPGGDPDTECYISILFGTGGGLTDNVNRWRNQAGVSPMTESDIKGLPRLKMLGEQAHLVEVAGSFRGMEGPEKEGFVLLGVICPFGDSTLFVKMTGPAKNVQRQRGKFLKFCKSIERE